MFPPLRQTTIFDANAGKLLEGCNPDFAKSPSGSLERVTQVIEIVWLVVALGKGFEQAAIAFNIIPLKRVDKGEKASRLKHARDFGGDPAANLVGQLVIKIDAGHDVEACAFERKRLGVRLLECHVAAAVKKALSLVEIGLAQIAADHGHGGERLGELREKAASPACHIQQPKLPLIAAADEIRNRRNGLAAHRARCPEEQRLNLDVIKPRRFLREPASCLIVEILSVVIRQTGGLRQRRRIRGPFFGTTLQQLRLVFYHTPHGFDAAHKRGALFDGDRIKTIADVACIFCLKLQNVLEERERAWDGLANFNARSITVMACGVPAYIAGKGGEADRAQSLAGEMREAFDSV